MLARRLRRRPNIKTTLVNASCSLGTLLYAIMSVDSRVGLRTDNNTMNTARGDQSVSEVASSRGYCHGACFSVRMLKPSHRKLTARIPPWMTVTMVTARVKRRPISGILLYFHIYLLCLVICVVTLMCGQWSLDSLLWTSAIFPENTRH